MKCIICGKSLKKNSVFYSAHEGKCTQVRRIVYNSVEDSKHYIKGTDDMEALELALQYEKRSVQPHKGIIQGIERRMRKIQKETKNNENSC